MIIVHVVEGKWASWTSWGSCSEECGNGEQKRTRKCEGPGTCIGEKEESKTCKLQNCGKNE